MTLASVLGVIFIVLKLVGVITWSWWLVLLPFYLGLVIWLVIILIGFLLASSGSATRTTRRFRK